MISNLFKAALIAGALLLSACSGVSTSSCFSEDCQSFYGHRSNNPNKLSFGGSAIGSSFSEYSSGLLHDD
ncbi:hypothetical protein ACYZUD_00695 [Pseudomonas sp. XS1P51]